MKDFDLTLALNGEQTPVTVHPYVDGETTYYDVMFTDYTVTIHKDTLYTWATDNPEGHSQADIQTIGEQVDNGQ